MDNIDDDKLNELYGSLNSINEDIIKRKIEIAKEKKEIVGSIDELVCKDHPSAKFAFKEKINDSWLYSLRVAGKDSLNVYQCKSCNEDKKVFKGSVAYDCPKCGIVVGEFDKSRYRSSEGSWRALAGREGENYNCKVCGTQIGHNYWKIS